MPAAGACRGYRTISARPKLCTRVLCASAEATVVAKTELPLLTTATYHQFLEDAGESLVVVDFYTDWCGPCKMIYPELVNMANEMTEVKFAKFNCNKDNKELGKTLGIKVAPTFHLYRKSVKVAEMTGAKVDKLRALISEQLATGQ